MLKGIRPWFRSHLGQKVLETEQAILEQLLPGYFGYHLLQMSVQDQCLYESSPIGHKFTLHGQFTSAAHQLPFENDSLDVILLHHLMDFHDAPQNLLREVSRVTRPQGQVVIIGFNPFSLWGLGKAILGWRGKAPWHGKFISPHRMMDWLNLLDFKIDRAEYCIHGLPRVRPTTINEATIEEIEDADADGKPDFSLGISRRTNWPFGAVYVIVARKQVGTMTPIKPIWKQTRTISELNVVRPAAGRQISTRNLSPKDKE